MILEVHDTEVGNSHLASIKDIDYDYMAEQWVQDFMNDETKRQRTKFNIASFILKDEEGVRAVWQVYENFDVALVEKSERFQGEWVLNSRFAPNLG